MQLFEIRFPEVEHLPPNERQVILERCVASSAVQEYRKKSLRLMVWVCMILCASGAVILTLLLEKPSFSLFFVNAAVSILCLIISVTLKTRGEVRLIRRLVRQELSQID